MCQEVWNQQVYFESLSASTFSVVLVVMGDLADLNHLLSGTPFLRVRRFPAQLPVTLTQSI